MVVTTLWDIPDLKLLQEYFLFIKLRITKNTSNSKPNIQDSQDIYNLIPVMNKTEKSFSLIGCAKHDNFLPLNDWLANGEMLTSVYTDIDCIMHV